MNNKYTIEIGYDELCLIESALELYGRVGMLQFEYLTLCKSLQSLIWIKGCSQEFKDGGDKLKSLFGYPPNGNPGIFNKEIVGDDCRKAIHIYQQLRHQRYLDRIKENPEETHEYGVYKYPADTCTIAGMNTPNFKFKENE
jgi:hypothetical protein